MTTSTEAPPSSPSSSPSSSSSSSSSSAPMSLSLPTDRELEEAQSERDRASRFATVAAFLPLIGLALGMLAASLDDGKVFLGAFGGVVVGSILSLPIGIASLLRLSQPRHAGRPGRGRSVVAIVVGLVLGWLPVLAVWLLIENSHWN